MATEQASRPEKDRPDQPSGMVELVERLNRFDGPPGVFLVNLLAVQCHVSGARCGAILRRRGDGQIEVLAVHPPLPQGPTSPVWLAKAAEVAPSVTSAGEVATHPLHDQEDLYGQVPRRHLVMIPLRAGENAVAMSTFVVEAADAASLAASRERLELTVSLLSLYEMRVTLQRRQADLRRLRSAMDTLSAVNEPDRFAGAAMAFCNELASRYQAERVSLGLLQGRYVHLRAMSHTEKFSRKMKLVRDLEAVQEECVDQDVEVVCPAPDSATFVNRAARELAARYGPSTVLSLPLRREGYPLAAVTLERPADRPFSPEEVETLRLTCELTVARLANLHEHDRWIGARAAASVKQGLAAAVGPKHTWAKVLAIIGSAVLAFLVFARGEYRIDAPCTLEATRQQLIAAPFDGYLKSVSVRPNDPVEAEQTILATLETAELDLQLAASKAEQLGYRKQADTAMRDGKTAEVQIAEAMAGKLAAQISLLEYQIAHAKIRSPIAGRVLAGDLERLKGSSVKTGDTLFVVGPLESLRAELSVSDEDVAEIREGLSGELATAAHPDRRIGFVVERINPVAEVIDQKNIFKVRVLLNERPDWMRPGMEGLAKITVDRRSYAWIWTRKLTNWVRMKLWW